MTATPQPVPEAVAASANAKVARRLLPVIVLCAFFAFLDRVNIGFAAIQMQADLGLSAAAFGLGAGIFFIAYFLFEIPSNLFMMRVSPGIWLTRIMLSWGLLSALTGFIPQMARASGLSHEILFYILRFLLGAAEAGFSPCVVFYISLWFPNARRARALAIYSAIVPASALIGAPLSGALLDIDALGLSGWQWMFLIEGLPATLLAPVAYWRLTAHPGQANWLTPAERSWLTTQIDSEQHDTGLHHEPLLRVLADRRILTLGLVLFLVLCSFYAILFFLPQVIAEFGSSNLQTGFIGAIPYLGSSIAMILWGRHSDQTGERRLHFSLSALLIAIGLAAVPHADSLAVKMAFFTMGAIGAFACMPVFWPICQSFLSGRAAAAGLALINSLGNLGGFAAPLLMGAVKDMTGSFAMAFYIMSALAVAAALLISLPQRRQRPDPGEMIPKMEG